MSWKNRWRTDAKFSREEGWFLNQLVRGAPLFCAMFRLQPCMTGLYGGDFRELGEHLAQNRSRKNCPSWRPN